MTPELEIDSLAFGGKGIGRLGGKAVFVPLTAPGDLVRVQITRERKNYAEAEMLELVRSSSLRRSPPCPVFGDCGGCQWQHLPYAEQCRWKERQLAEILRRQAGVEAPPVRRLIPSPDEWRYRSRVQFKCRQTARGFAMGFYRRGSHFVVDVEDCPIAAAPLNEALRLFRAWLPASPCPTAIPQVDLEAGDERRVRAVVHFIGPHDRSLGDYLRPRADEHGISLFLQSGRKETLVHLCGEPDLRVRVGEPSLALAYGAGGFAQVNLAQNRNLIREVVQAAAFADGGRILDLFCGMGNLSLPLARVASEVLGVEAYAPSIAKARENARRCGITNVAFHAVAAEEAARRPDLPGVFDLVVLDPPRSGAFEVAKGLLSARPSRILYVSCEPTTMARDLLPLLHGGYFLNWVRPFDFFPQTGHIECVCLLESRQVPARLQ